MAGCLNGAQPAQYWCKGVKSSQQQIEGFKTGEPCNNIPHSLDWAREKWTLKREFSRHPNQVLPSRGNSACGTLACRCLTDNGDSERSARIPKRHNRRWRSPAGALTCPFIQAATAVATSTRGAVVLIFEVTLRNTDVRRSPAGASPWSATEG